MKTKNIFRMLLVAAALLLGANNVKADETFNLWESPNGNAGTDMSGWTEIKDLDNELLQKISAGDEIKFYGSTITTNTNITVALFSNSNLVVGMAYQWNGQPFINGIASYTVTESQETTLHNTTYPAYLVGAGVNISKVEVFHSGKIKLVLSFSETEKSVKMGETLSSPALNNTSVSVTYSSANTNIATVDASTGVVTPVHTGNTNIIATFAGDDAYAEATATYKVTVQKGDPNLSFTEETMSIKVGETKASPILNNPHNLTVGYFAYYTDPIILNSTTGVVTGRFAATDVEIYAAVDANDNWNYSEAKYKLTITEAEQPQKQNSSITFSGNGNESVVFGNTFTAPTVTTTPENAALTYESSNETVAKIINGNVVPVGAGTTTIKAKYAGDDTYNGTEATYNLTVTAPTTSGAVWEGAVWLGNWGEGGSHPNLQTNDAFKAIKSGDQLLIYGKMGPLHETDFNLELFQLNNDWSWGTKFVNLSKNDFSTTDGCFTVNVNNDNVNSLQNGLKDNKDGYCAAVNGYNFTITAIKVIAGQAPADTRADVTLAFSASTGSATVGQTPTNIPTLTATSNGETVSGLAITYTSSNTSVAQVNATTGAITPVAAGSTTITATFAGDTNYKPAQSVSYILTVNAAPQTPEYITVDMGSYEYRTYVTTTNVDFSQSVGIKGYYASGLNSDHTAVLFTRVTGVVPASVPLLLQKISGAFEYKLRKTDATGTEPNPNMLHAGYSSSFDRWIWGDNIYVLTVHNGQVVFAEVKDSNKKAEVDDKHAYLYLNGINARGRLIISFDDNNEGATSINTVESDEEGTEVIYDLRGQRVQNPAKGVYIINGKKIVIK